MTELEKHFTVQSHLNNLCILLNGTLKSPTPLTTQENKHQSTPSSLKDPTIPILMFLGVIVATLSVIVVFGYFHGNMHLITTLKNAASS